MKEKILGIVFVAAALGLGWFAYNLPEDEKQKPSKALTFSEFVSEDIEQLKKADEKRKEKALPDAWNSIQTVSYNFHSDFQKKLMNDQKLQIPESISGTHKLEIEFIDVPDEESPSIILQMSLIENASNNKVWELGRTYSLASFIKKDPAQTTDQKAAAADSNSGNETEKNTQETQLEKSVNESPEKSPAIKAETAATKEQPTK